ncbi:biotin transporter BioY [Nesterenkonia xinjiangensis]|uniref:Biotin transport system substrate-specific component n=1 Tax=Nesterenkonia xinjiangensis TaxID=225327 RepID=A0A7Z0GJG4_9MICC|nr:biotin transporter BioY [Nesterenkonia xinjiangensis]NYJ77095.1 biotin transport system substrate-specific component [Nesterenkonia xinjiangensis]
MTPPAGPQHPTTPEASTSGSDARPYEALVAGPATASVRGVAQMAMFAALVGVLGQPFAIPLIGGVPVTLQTLGVMLAGAILGPWRGAGSMLLLHALVAAGLPLLSQGSGGLGVYAGPTAGFALGWIPAAFVIGLITQWRWPLAWWRTGLGVTLGGIGVIYLCGIPVMAHQLGLTLTQAAFASAGFLPGDAAKAVIAVGITHALIRAYPAPFTWARRR